MMFRKKVVPTQKNMVEEIKRRSICITDDPIPSCKHWTKERLQRWLTENPVEVADDVSFLVAEELKLCEFLNKARNEQGGGRGDSRSLPCLTNEPYLCMYHSMFHNDVRPAFLLRGMYHSMFHNDVRPAFLLRMNNTLARLELDARNSAACPETFFEAVARIFNDDDIVFETDVLPVVSVSFLEDPGMDS
jgi:hypothetical protein